MFNRKRNAVDPADHHCDDTPAAELPADVSGKLEPIRVEHAQDNEYPEEEYGEDAEQYRRNSALRAANANVAALKTAIRKKPGWSQKVFDHRIADRYIAEAIQQGMQLEQATRAISELRSFAHEPVNDHYVRHADGLIPADLTAVIATELERIASRSDKDWHPGSEEKVQDLIHPSLYPYIEGVSAILPSSKFRDPKAREAVHLQRGEHVMFFGRPFESSQKGYQWLPSIYDVDASGRVQIKSYINNLNYQVYPLLYQAFASAFERVLPLLEQVTKQNLRGRSLQVITKACQYVLKPGQNYQGVWHVEGMPSEHIVASAIYYYHSSPFLEDDGLAFRRARDEESDYPNVMDYTHDNPPPGGETDWQMNIELGAVPTIQGRVLCFRNDLQHCVTLLHNPSKSNAVAYRKIICFFLVDPKKTLISTADVLPQQWARVRNRQATALTLLSRRVLGPGRQLSRDVVLYLLDRFAKVGLTEEEAKKHRLELMRERKFHINEQNMEMEREFSLCEH